MGAVTVGAATPSVVGLAMAADETAPTRPTNLTVTGRSSSTVGLSWDPASDGGGSGLAAYEIAVNGEIDHSVDAGATATTVADLAYDRRYEFAVVAVDGAGNRSDPATVTAWTESAIYDPPPRPPERVTATPASTTSVAVEWTPPEELAPDHDGWVVLVDGTEVQSVAPSRVATTVTDLSSGTTYEVGVGAVDESGTRSQLATDQVTTAEAPGTPGPVSGSAPRDLDGDGRYRDLDGNGRLDRGDVLTYFEHMNEPAMADEVDAFDYNGNGRIDFDDLVTLFEAF